jgi:hypothetical protein
VITRPRFFELLTLALILFLAAYLRLSNVATNPAWYTDEGTHLDIARHLLTGRVQYLAINQPWLLASRLPLFEGLLTIAARFNGVSMETLRLLTGSLGVVTVGLMYAVMHRISRDRLLALLTALLLAIYPPAVLYSRFGFSYNLLAPLLLLTLLGEGKYTAARSSTALNSAHAMPSAKPRWRTRWNAPRRWLAVASLAIGLGALSDLWMFVVSAPFALIVLIHNWRDLLWSVPLALLPFGIYAAITLAIAPQVFLFDVHFILSRVNQLPLDRQVATVWQNLSTLGAQDVWMIAGSLGLLLLKLPRLRWISLAFFVIPIVLLGRTTALFSLSFYYLITLLPLVALGAASLMRYGMPWLSSVLIRRIRSAVDVSMPAQAGWINLLVAAPIVIVLSISTAGLVRQVRDGFRTDIDGFLLDPIAAQAAAAFVNQQAEVDDLVIASPTLAWLLKAQVADMQMPSAYRGQATPHLPADIPPERWAFDPSVERARFVIVDDLWRNWAVPNVPGVSEMLHKIETWPLVLRSGEIVIYQNPED